MRAPGQAGRPPDNLELPGVRHSECCNPQRRGWCYESVPRTYIPVSDIPGVGQLLSPCRYLHCDPDEFEVDQSEANIGQGGPARWVAVAQDQVLQTYPRPE